MIRKVPNYTNTDSDLTFSVNRARKIENLEKSYRKFSHRPKSEQYIGNISKFFKNQYWYWYWQYQFIAAIYCSAIYWFVSLVLRRPVPSLGPVVQLTNNWLNYVLVSYAFQNHVALGQNILFQEYKWNTLTPCRLWLVLVDLSIHQKRRWSNPKQLD